MSGTSANRGAGGVVDEGPPAKRPTRSTKRSENRHRHSSAIHRAIEANDWGAITILLQQGEKFCSGDGLNCPILAAVAMGLQSHSRWNLVKRIVETDPSCVNAKNIDGTTLLMIFANDAEQVRFLVEHGANVNDVDFNGNPVLMRSFSHKKASFAGFSEILGCIQDEEVLHTFLLKLAEPEIAQSSILLNWELKEKMLRLLFATKTMSFLNRQTHPLVVATGKPCPPGRSQEKFYLLVQLLAESTLPPVRMDPPLVVSRDTLLLLDDEHHTRMLELVRRGLDLPDQADFDMAGLFLLNLHVKSLPSLHSPDQSGLPMRSTVLEILSLLLERRHLDQTGHTTDPLLALMLNIFRHHIWGHAALQCWRLIDNNDKILLTYPYSLSMQLPLGFMDLIDHIKDAAIRFNWNESPEIHRLTELAAHIAYLAALSFGYFKIPPLCLKILEYSPHHPFEFLLHLQEAPSFISTYNAARQQCVVKVTRYLHHFLSVENSTHKMLPYGPLGGLAEGAKIEQLIQQINAMRYPPNPPLNVDTSICSLQGLSLWALRGHILDQARYQGCSAKNLLEEIVLRKQLPKPIAASVCISDSPWPSKFLVERDRHQAWPETCTIVNDIR